ncbi:MAG: histidine phosphatase family protein [Alphaproteobacteria bacterium]|nr:histidine phosphatase family protein [Alphaproteobacteria bacterium]
MTELLLLRHGPTSEATEARLKGRLDVPLSDAGRAEIAAWRLPILFAAARWYASPLARTRETATILGLSAIADPRLIEMDWGRWEGHSLEELRAADPEGVAANEARGLDFRPPGGESPRTVQARLMPWLAEAAAAAGPVGAVTHKGVIRALIGLATGWDFLGPPPARIGYGLGYHLRLGRDGTPAVVRPGFALGSEP